MRIKTATDFTTAPGPRHISEGRFSGEQFRKELLLPKVREALEKKCELIVDLDGTSGYGTSWFEESFGGLIRIDKIPLATLDRLPLKIISNEDPDYIDRKSTRLNSSHLGIS